MQRSEFEPIKKYLSQENIPKTPAPTGVTEITDEVRAEIQKIASEIKDISGRFGQVNDIWEIFKKAFGKK